MKVLWLYFVSVPRYIENDEEEEEEGDSPILTITIHQTRHSSRSLIHNTEPWSIFRAVINRKICTYYQTLTLVGSSVVASLNFQSWLFFFSSFDVNFNP